MPTGMLLAPIGNPEPRGYSPLYTPPFSLKWCSHRKAAFSYVRPFFENVTSHGNSLATLLRQGRQCVKDTLNAKVSIAKGDQFLYLVAFIVDYSVIFFFMTARTLLKHHFFPVANITPAMAVAITVPAIP